VLGNIIGLNAAGTAALANTGDGVNVAAALGSGYQYLGASGAGNVISGNLGNGIDIAVLTYGNIQGNLIGTNAQGNAAIPNGLAGIFDAGLSGTIGGSTSDLRNVISGNTGDGITTSGLVTYTIQGNLIGTDSTGQMPLGNGGTGVHLTNYNSYGNLVGNTIAHNGQFGVDGDDSLIYFTTVQGNSIFANPSGGIIWQNGGNNGITAPVLTSATLMGGNLQVQGTASSAPYGTPAKLEIFDNAVGDSPVEGRKSLGTVTLNSLGAFNVTVPASSASLITVTLTDAGGDTSPFSNPVPVQNPCDTDVSARTSVAHGPMRYNTATHRITQADTITNTSNSAISAPLYLAIDNLSSNASVASPSGSTSCNLPASPYVTVLSSGSLAAGASVQVQLQFNDPSLAGYTYTTRVLAGAGQP
jgi:hypothetical protein